MTIHVPISATGRMSLPAAIRKRLGVGKGGELILEETADGVVLRTPAQSLEKARKLARALSQGKPGATVDDFLARRRGEWGE